MSGAVELAAPFHGYGRGHFTVFKGGNRRFEIARIGHAIRANRAATGQFEFLTIVFADKAARGAFEDFDTIKQATRAGSRSLWVPDQ